MFANALTRNAMPFEAQVEGTSKAKTKTTMAGTKSTAINQANGTDTDGACAGPIFC
jgi:hypothetical protein